MREALKVLAAEGLVELLPNRGAIVARITPEEVEELFPIMGALEALAGKVACGRITDVEIASIQQTHDRMVQHYNRNECLPYEKLNRDIHEAIFAVAGNGTLTALYHQLMIRTHSIRFAVRKSREQWRQSVEQHNDIMAALKQRNGEALASILDLHVKYRADVVMEALVQVPAHEN